MSETITGATTNYSATATVPTDGDARTAASVKTPFQRLLDNCAYLYDQLVTQGATRIRRVADTTALKAINTTTGISDGDVRLVGDATSFSGVYVYESGSSATEELPWIVQPTTGSGRWYHSAHRFRYPEMGIVDHVHDDALGSDTTASGSYTVVSHSAIPFTANAGDIVECWIRLRMNPGAANKSYARVRWTKPDTSTEVIGESVAAALTASADNYETIMFTRSIVDAGTYDVVVQHYSNDGTTTVTTEVLSVVLNVRRP